MLWIAAVLIAVTSNLDNLAVGVALGLRPIAVSATANVAIAAVTTIGTGVAMSFGAALGRVGPESLAHILGGLTLVVIGARMIVTGAGALRRGIVSGPRRDRSAFRDPLSAVADTSPGASLRLRDALVLGVALAVNNVASGIPAGASGISPILVSGLAGAVSLLCVGGGARFGSTLGLRIAGRYSSALAGAVMLAVGMAAVAR